MPPNLPTWWTDERVQETVDSQYVHSHLRPDEQLLLKKSPSFGDGLTDDTYLDWVLTRAKRLFLILVDVGVPDQIFGVVDDSYDDDDLPIAEEAVPNLRLSFKPNAGLDKRFYKTQFRYLIRIVGDSEHIRYAEEETVPVYPIGLKSTMLSLSKDGTDHVWLPSDLTRVFTRKRIALNDRVTEHGVLSEITTHKKYGHEHLVSYFGSYKADESVYILFTPAAEYNLKSFLSDVPKAFESLPKPEKRQLMIDWPHCLATGLAWLHENGQPHGAIRPSNILIDSHFRIFFGSFDGSGMLDTSAKISNIEAYQYAAPERWKRAVTMQSTGPAKTSGHSGGRTAHKIKKSIDIDDGSHSKRSSGSYGMRLETATPTATAYAFIPTSKSNFSRLQLGKADTDSILSFTSAGSKSSNKGSVATVRPSYSLGPRTDTPSAISYNTSSSGSNRAAKAAITNPIFVAAPEMRTAMVQTWRSAQFDYFSADLFSLGAVVLGILTLLCKRSYASFERQRSSKNRTAGRGGGLADASFHANLGQVTLWANILQEDAKKKAKKDDGKVYRVVGPVLQLVNQCLSRDPDERLTAASLEKMLAEYITLFTDIDHLHCKREVSNELQTPARERPTPPPTRALPRTIIPTSLPEDEITPAPRRVDSWTKLRSKGLVTATIPAYDPESSLSSLSTFNFDYDVTSETVVEDDRSQVTTNPSEAFVSRPVTADASELAKKSKAKAKRAEPYINLHNNDSAVDPRLSTSPSSPGGGFNYQNYNDSFSSEDDRGGRSFFLPESRPSSMSMKPAPAGPLPPIPGKRKSRRNDSFGVRPEAFPAVPRRKDSHENFSPTPPLLSGLDMNARDISLQPPLEITKKVSRENVEQQWQTASLSNPDSVSRSRAAKDGGRSWMEMREAIQNDGRL